MSDKADLLRSYDEFPKLSQREAASKLKISQLLLCKLLRYRGEIEKDEIKSDHEVARDWIVHENDLSYCLNFPQRIFLMLTKLLCIIVLYLNIRTFLKVKIFKLSKYAKSA